MSDDNIPLEVHNIDRPGSKLPRSDPALQCAYLEIEASPTRSLVSGASLKSYNTLFDIPFKVVAYNTFGAPVQTSAVSMFLFDAAGVHAYHGKSSSHDYRVIEFGIVFHG